VAAADEIAARSLASRAYRLHKAAVRIDGGRYLDWTRYPYCVEILDDDCRETTIIKAAQAGLTIVCVLKAVEQACAEDLRGIGYFFPTHGETLDFSKARFGPMLEYNPGIWPSVKSEVDSAGLRQFGETFVYLRGAGQRGGGSNRSTSPIKSIPLDRIFFDEFDEMDPNRVDAAMHRLDGSTEPQTTKLSTPTLPGYGVDLDYQQSDQRHWYWQCQRCRHGTCLELEYPDCIAEPLGGEPYYLCRHCHEPLDRVEGVWHAHRPEVLDHRGYWISQLSTPTKTAADIIQASLEADRVGRHREFTNQTLGRPYAEVEDQITREQLEERQTEQPRPLSHPGPCCMGVDPGKPHWYEVRARVTENDFEQVARGQADSYEELARIAKRYNVTSGCMDQGYDPSAVSSFVRAHKGWWGCLYVNSKRTDPDWDAKNRVVKAGRDRVLDESHHEILSGRISFYAKDDGWEQFVAQMCNLKRTMIEDATTGGRTSRWVVTGGMKNDHLRHAGTYAYLSGTRVGMAKQSRRAYESARKAVRQPRPKSAMVL